MSLRFRRNLPIVLLLVGILSALALTMGNQPIVSYTVNVNTVRTTTIGAEVTGWSAANATAVSTVNGASALVTLP